MPRRPRPPRGGSGGTRVDLDPAGMADLLKSSDVAAEMRRRADKALAAAQADAPVVSGAYRNSLTVEDAVTDRAGARVIADVPYANRVEAKNGVLAKALDAAGGDS